MIEVAQANDLAALLASRNDPMAACKAKWLKHLAKVPENAAVPLAMSGPHPRAVGSYGADCIEWARVELGITLRWWQALAVTRQLEHDESGALVWREIVETGPRRIGKSVRLRVVALWRIANAHRIGEPQLAMLVSKDLAVGKEIHRGAWRWAETKDWKVTRLNGGQEVEAPGENRWLLRADTAVYGYDVGYGQVDESWGVDPQSITDGLEPALLERLWAQLHLTSTAHVRATSLMRRRLTAALRDADPDVLLLMWGARPGADLSLESTWRDASPHWSEDRRALIGRKYAAALAGQDEPEFDDPDPIRGWAAQYLNVWPLLVGGRAEGILPNWANLATDAPAPKPETLGIAASLDQSWLSLGAASTAGERPHIGSVLRLRASDQAQFVSEVYRIQSEQGCAVAIDEKGPASFLIPALELAGVALTKLDMGEFIQACADLANAVERSEVEHGDYGDLNSAVESAGWRQVGDRRAFARKLGDISALEAVACALYIASHSRVFWGAFG